MQRPKPRNMTPEAATYHKHMYDHVDHVVDALNMLVLQNDPREPVLEFLIQE